MNRCFSNLLVAGFLLVFTLSAQQASAATKKYSFGIRLTTDSLDAASAFAGQSISGSFSIDTVANSLSNAGQSSVYSVSNFQVSFSGGFSAVANSGSFTVANMGNLGTAVDNSADQWSQLVRKWTRSKKVVDFVDGNFVVTFGDEIASSGGGISALTNSTAPYLITDLRFNARSPSLASVPSIPVPAAFPLLLAAIGVMGMVGKRGRRVER